MEDAPTLLFEGLYRSESTLSPEDRELEYPPTQTWHYLRFYPAPGKWVVWANSFGSPLEVARWLNVYNTDNDHGKYTLRKHSLTFSLKQEKDEHDIRLRGTLVSHGLLLEESSNGYSILPWIPFRFDFVAIPGIDRVYMNTLKQKIQNNIPLDDFDRGPRVVADLKKYLDELTECCGQNATPVGREVLTILKNKAPVKGCKYDILL